MVSAVLKEGRNIENCCDPSRSLMPRVKDSLRSSSFFQLFLSVNEKGGLVAGGLISCQGRTVPIANLSISVVTYGWMDICLFQRPKEK